MSSTITVQLLRIIMNAAGAALLGDAVASSDQYQALIGATMSFLSGLWWAITEYRAKH